MYKDRCKQEQHRISFTQNYREVGKGALAILLEVNNITHFCMVKNVLYVVIIYYRSQ